MKASMNKIASTSYFMTQNVIWNWAQYDGTEISQKIKNISLLSITMLGSVNLLWFESFKESSWLSLIKEASLTNKIVKLIIWLLQAGSIWLWSWWLYHLSIFGTFPVSNPLFWSCKEEKRLPLASSYTLLFYMHTAHSHTIYGICIGFSAFLQSLLKLSFFPNAGTQTPYFMGSRIW